MPPVNMETEKINNPHAVNFKPSLDPLLLNDTDAAKAKKAYAIKALATCSSNQMVNNASGNGRTSLGIMVATDMKKVAIITAGPKDSICRIIINSPKIHQARKLRGSKRPLSGR
jgi:Ni,Fe-hydrogenase I small subunit